MTTETTATTATTETVDKAKTAAVEYVGNHSMSDIIEHLANQYKYLQASKDANNEVRTRLQKLVDNVTEFIKDNLEDGCGTQELKDLAEELDISLTKDMSISFTVKYYADITVPLDFDTDKIDESDFRISIEFQGNDNDIDWDNDSTEVEDFEIEEN